MELLAREAQEALRQRSHRLRARASSGVGGLSFTQSEEQELRDIEDALARIAHGEFGRCARCGGAIGRHRLRAVPEARHCLTCAALAR